MLRATLPFWGMLLGSVVLLTLLLAALARSPHGGMRDPDEAPRRSAALRARQQARTAALGVFANSAAASAQRAVQRARHTAAALTAAENARDAAWQDYQRAGQAAQDALTAAAPAPVPALAEDGRHDVSRAALAAYRRGDLTEDQLRTIWKLVDGWDPDRADREHELIHLRAAEVRARLAHQHSVAAEDAARQAALVAEVAARALAQEAVDARWDAQDAADRSRRRW